MPILKEHPPDPAHQTATHPSEISMRNEILRKMIHLCSIGIPALYIFLSRETMLWLLVPATILSVGVELIRLRVPAVERALRSVFGPIMREHELAEGKAKLSGASWVLLSATLCIFIFPKVITIAGFTILIISDTAAALFGRKYGRHKFLEKSVEGSSAFFVTAFIVVLVVNAIFAGPWMFVWVGAIGALVATAAEALSHGANIDDNLTIPTSFGIVVWSILGLIGGPEVERLLEFGRGAF